VDNVSRETFYDMGRYWPKNEETSAKVNFDTCCSISGLRVYPNGTATVERFRVPGRLKNNYPRLRGKIKGLTRRSLERMVFTVTETQLKFKSMLTLTYPDTYPDDGRKVKRDLQAMLKILRRGLGADYIWFLEFQTRGAPHFHILLSVPVQRQFYVAGKWALLVTDNDKDFRRVAAVHSHRSQWENLRSEDGAKRYVAKYAAKAEQKEVPEHYRNVGRFWGASVGVKVGVYGGTLLEMDEEDIRQFLVTIGHRCSDWEVLPKMIFGLTDRSESDE